MRAKLAKILMLTLSLMGILASPLIFVASSSAHEESWVFTYINEAPYGNWTFTRKPVSPVKINASQIQIGTNWTYVYTLVANRTYHVYCYGDWIDYGPRPKTDYDVYVYNPLGELEGYHTEAAGLPEHLGSTVDQPFFTPKYSGNYSFVIRNDPRESQGAEPATFMVIEHVETNVWHSRFIEGKQGDVPVENTSWAYGFVSSSDHIEIRIEVPETLDMYEARLYLMANPSNKKGEFLNGVPLAWEPGLYGEVGGVFGGYNLDSRGFRGNAYASCEYFGQNMLINYTAPYKGESLYHLVLIGEYGAGNVSFRVKTDFGSSVLQLATPLQRVFPDNETVIMAVSNHSNIQQASLHYSTDDWNTSTTIEMATNNRTCTATIPGQMAGVTVDYLVEAFDSIDNLMTLNGSYAVKYPTTLNLTWGKEMVTIGENVSISGIATPSLDLANARLKLIFTAANGSKVEQQQYLQDGNFSVSFRAPFLGPWSVQAQLLEDDVRYAALSNTIQFIVVEPSFVSKYSIYIYAGVGVVITALIVVFVIRRRE